MKRSRASSSVSVASLPGAAPGKPGESGPTSVPNRNRASSTVSVSSQSAKDVKKPQRERASSTASAASLRKPPAPAPPITAVHHPLAAAAAVVSEPTAGFSAPASSSMMTSQYRGLPPFGFNGAPQPPKQHPYPDYHGLPRSKYAPPEDDPKLLERGLYKRLKATSHPEIESYYLIPRKACYQDETFALAHSDRVPSKYAYPASAAHSVLEAYKTDLKRLSRLSNKFKSGSGFEDPRQQRDRAEAEAFFSSHNDRGKSGETSDNEDGERDSLQLNDSELEDEDEAGDYSMRNDVDDDDEDGDERDGGGGED